MTGFSRRTVLKATGAAALSAMLGPSMWRSVLAGGPEVTTGSRYGPLRPPDANGIRLPAGFTSRVVARTGDPVGSTAHLWHAAPDGGGCWSAPGGGWRYISNAEVGGGGGGVSVIEFDRRARIVDAYTILSGTNRNCAGGFTPSGNWLSCEESCAGGHVWECDPRAAGQGTRRALLGSFNHEAAAVDPATGIVYLTEDDPAGRLYRFVPTTAGDLTSGVLQAAEVGGDPSAGPAPILWRTTSSDAPDRSPNTTPFDGGEGEWIHDGHMLFTTKGDRRIWEFDTAAQTVEVLHDCVLHPEQPLDAVDNIVVHHRTGDIFVAEDGGNMELCSIERRADGSRRVGAFLRIEGQDASEVTGPGFTPDGRRLYVSSQRGSDGRGITYEITGRFQPLDLDDGGITPRRPAGRVGNSASIRSLPPAWRLR
ncbi:MAG: alkaline phosphatase PhoX [Ilumatobacteraceae bacterium]